MTILSCGRCLTKNRVPHFRVNARAVCGKCGSPLPEPRWVLLVRQLRRSWPIFAGGFALLAYLAFQADSRPRVTQPERAWAEPAASPAATDASRLQPIVASQAPPESRAPSRPPPISPVISCVPVAVRSGSSAIYSRKARLAPLKIKTPNDGNYLVKLVDYGTKRVAMSVYIAGGDTKIFKVPLGTYSIYYAQGQVWCGEKEGFGRSNTHLMRLVGRFSFTRDTQGFNGVELELAKRLDGNLRSEEVTDREFSELVPDEPGKGG